ncbi:NlpC/P60 family peptidoglycan-binding protein RipD [Mycolicibacterium rufum]|uniref:NlpC/P60 family peptidoglycan-binding protein RipD n=1 Tax=Mycolicibacterium rufum TaxID=318424 RepID=A0A9X2YDV8_9MYCO|nr:NlpC/P60 family peptidoglycan-binding protein RipD [Mycolicibacterium rufum]KGI68486.1 hydrolase [Mycolicibacterium rufum]MCV7071943.1 NlpC/P60 family peptidoglycan-binding protein RipD [Mycolicibacterium rufum]ULP34594.1 NlpC/P60 family peptidoglycan-binding protein RipD [Mycolicibacterium rufum]
MRRVRVFVVLVLGFALLMATPGLAAAQPARSATNQKAVEIVIARALSQRGVPFAYGGGGASGPSKGTVAAPTADPAQPDQAGVDASALDLTTPGLNLPAAAPAAAPAPAPRVEVVGFDASGLMVYSYAGVGVKLPRSSGEMYKVGQKVMPSLALPGDLLFYGPEGTQSVALFIGNGKMVETTDSGVAVSDVRTKDMTPYLVRIIA